MKLTNLFLPPAMLLNPQGGLWCEDHEERCPDAARLLEVVDDD
jgi:hypothetical protein